MSPASPISVPLHAQVPNPPRLFVGRQGEAQSLAHLLTAGPVTVVEGAHGLGKTSLVAHTLRAAPHLEARALQLSVQGAGGLVSWLEALRGAQCAALGQQPPTPQGDAQAWAAEVLRLSELGQLVVVADDTGEVPDHALLPLVELVTRHARASRWVFVRPHPLPVLALLEQTVSVGPLAPAEMAHLAAGLAGGRAPLTAAQIAACGGSPLRLRQAVLAARMVPAQAAARQVLAVSRQALHRDQLQGLTGLDATGLDALAEGGDAEQVGDLIRLAERHRAQVLAEAPAAELSAHRDALLDEAPDDDPAAVLERVRLLAEAGRFQSLGELLQARLVDLVDAGRSGSLWAVLAPHAEHPEVRPPCLALAAMSRSGVGLVQWALAQPRPEEPVARWRWAQARFHAGARIEARDVLRTLDGVDFGPLTVDVALSRALVERRFGDRHRATALMETAEAAARSAEDRAGVAASWVDHHASAMNYAAAEQALGRLSAAWAQLDDPARRRAFIDYSTALLYLGRHAALFEAAQAVYGADALADGGLLTRSNLLVALARDLRLATVQTLCAQRAALSERPHVVDRTFTYFGALAALHAGRIGEARVALYGPGAAEHPRRSLAGLQAELAAWEGQPPAGEVPPQPKGPRALVTALTQAHHHLRAGRPAPQLTPPPGVEASVFLHGQFALNRAVHQLLTGDLAGAAQTLAVVAERGERHRARLLTARAAELAADGAWLQGDTPARRRWIATLDALAEHGPSARLADLAAFQRALEPFDPAAVAQLARSEAAPRVARRAQALLGAPVPLDRLDEPVLASLPRPAWVNRAGAEPWTPGWGASASARVVWLADGSAHPVGPRSNHLALLSALVAGGGRCDKEALVQAVWGDPYDPRIHDRRIYMAINRLRQRLGDDASEPRLVVTTPEGGYAIGGALRFTWFA